MTPQFDPIRLTGLDEGHSHPLDNHSGFLKITLVLSDHATDEWAGFFSKRWARHVYPMKRSASVTGSWLQIDCPPEELQDTHLPELKKVVAETNQDYVSFLQVQSVDHESKMAREPSVAEKLKKLKDSLIFD